MENDKREIRLTHEVEVPRSLVFEAFTKPELLKYDHFGHKDEDGDPPHFKATITFEDLGGKTNFSMQMVFPTDEARNKAAEFGAIEGGKQTLNRLDKYLKKQLDP